MESLDKNTIAICHLENDHRGVSLQYHFHILVSEAIRPITDIFSYLVGETNDVKISFSMLSLRWSWNFVNSTAGSITGGKKGQTSKNLLWLSGTSALFLRGTSSINLKSELYIVLSL